MNPNKTSTNFTVGEDGSVHLDEESELFITNLVDALMLLFTFMLCLLQNSGCRGVVFSSIQELLKFGQTTLDMQRRVSHAIPFSYSLCHEL